MDYYNLGFYQCGNIALIKKLAEIWEHCYKKSQRGKTKNEHI